MKWLLVLYMLILSFAGCGSEGNSHTHVNPVTYRVASAEEASAFLSRATFGATREEIDDLVSGGDYEAWLEAQFAKAPTYHVAWAHAHAKGVGRVPDLSLHREDWKTYSDALGDLQRDAWWDIAVYGEDQLRQRVAFALSEVLVISRNGPLLTYPDARMSYYDVLVKNAFGNFETLLREVTYHPAMGRYLSYLGNAKADPSVGSHPDENYAREVMQLFTIGLYELNMDGTYKTIGGRRIATYTQDDIREMARVFTGLSDDNGHFETEACFDSYHARTSPMAAFETYHDTGEKRILHARKIIPAGGDTKTDINTALHLLFEHPNTAPFISRQLIQRLVTSNPSPAYVERVARVFADNGRGVRGDLKAVVKAILLDEEALHGKENDPEHFGKFREPMLYITHLWRAFHAQNAENNLTQGDDVLYRYKSFNFHGTGMMKQEGPLEALTVFNYFAPDDAPAALKKRNLAAPELELYGKQGIDDVLMGLITKNGFVYRTFHITAALQFEQEKELVHSKKHDALLDRLDLILTGGNLSQNTRSAIKRYMQNHSGLSDENLTRLTIGLVMTSPDYALQR
ncbi:DUF1800 domain-containing protein [Hydrogenimonas urashimensis]|uniref:DUF1800 domain-containing protein n=1 Tax=Hydrogenimonas urashimensis TaxID=2740515 RepID=UPI001914FFBD|nr:DUF1800 domain-containing protein [Hydrogenimonas urashimensis]